MFPEALTVWFNILTNDAVGANDAVVGVNVILVAALAVVANEALIVLLAQLEVPLKVPVNEPEKLPVFICNELDTVPTGNIVGANDALTELLAQLEVPSKLPVIPPDVNLREPVISASPITCNSTTALLDSITDPVMRWFPTNAFEPVVANTVEFSPSNKSAFAAYDADVMLPEKLPVLICRELDTVPTGNPVGKTYDDEIAKLAVTERLAVAADEADVANVAKLDVDANDAVDGVNVILVAALAVTALFAQLAVPNIVPTFVMLFPPNDRFPAIARVPFTNKYCGWSSADNPSRFPWTEEAFTPVALNPIIGRIS
jgi:hypothetical protein